MFYIIDAECLDFFVKNQEAHILDENICYWTYEARERQKMMLLIENKKTIILPNVQQYIQHYTYYTRASHSEAVWVITMHI